MSGRRVHYNGVLIVRVVLCHVPTDYLKQASNDRPDYRETSTWLCPRGLFQIATSEPTLARMQNVARIYLDRLDMADDLRRTLDLLSEGSGTAGECAPPCDVVETAGGIEVVMDVPGVTRESLNIVFVRHTLVIAGEKLPATCEHRHAAFHLAERTFGRFTRAVRLSGAFDAGAATARLASGELRIVLPRIRERRGAEIRIAVQAG